ncbi:50S ribosomal protein L13 [archaeon SCG-AAA382B04]|nr:50S ribosomal protein L13 [archaeon SCG-AAA382B04]
MIIDAHNAVLGRLASEVAKKAKIGEEITIINAEEAIITGNKDQILEKYKKRYERGSKDWGPHYPRVPDRIVRKTIRGMLPYKQQKGKKALENITVRMGEPSEIDTQDAQKIAEASEKALASNKYIKIKEISSHLGWQSK